MLATFFLFYHFQKMKILQLLKVGDYMKTITRTKYLDRIIKLNGTPGIKVITGIRRSGKPKLIQAYIEYLTSRSIARTKHSKYSYDGTKSQKSFLETVSYVIIFANQFSTS